MNEAPFWLTARSNSRSAIRNSAPRSSGCGPRTFPIRRVGEVAASADAVAVRRQPGWSTPDAARAPRRGEGDHRLWFDAPAANVGVRPDGRFGNAVRLCGRPPHRVGGAAIGIQRALAEGSRNAGFDFLIGLPNKKALPIVKRVGYHVVGDVHAWVKPLRSAYKLCRASQEPAAREDRRTAAGPRASVPRPAPGSAATRPRGRDHRSRGRPLRRALGARARALPDHRRKTSAFLNWRYGGFTTQHFQMFALTSKQGAEVAGFVIFEIKGNKVFVIDLFAEDLAGDARPAPDGVSRGACGARATSRSF